jgi:hypothetical protein
VLPDLLVYFSNERKKTIGGIRLTGGLRTRTALHMGDILTTALLPGFSCPVDELFRARL